MTITHDVCLNDHRHNDYHHDHHSPPNGTYCHSDLEESNNDFIQVFIISIIVFFPHVIVYLNNGFHQHHCLYLCLYCYHHTIIFMINHHNHYRRLPLNIVRNQNPPQVLGGWRLGSDGSSQKGDAYFCGGGNATTVPDIYGEDIFIHSKSEKVCGTAFSVKKNCGKSA